MSSVKRVAVSNVLIPRSQSITCVFPSRTTYSAAISSSSIVADEPRFRSTGLFALPTSASSEKFGMLRAPIWITSDRLDDRLDLARIHQLGHDRQPRLLARLGEDLRAPRGRAPGTCTATCAA